MANEDRKFKDKNEKYLKNGENRNVTYDEDKNRIFDKF